MATDRITFPDISPSAWEHPADKAALNALRRIPGFDQVLRGLYAMFGEKVVRLTFQANAVRVSEKQYPWVHERLLSVCEVFDVQEIPEVYVSQTPLVNAGAVGLDKPFIVLNSSTIEILDAAQLESVIGHEMGHILSGHVLYNTMLHILLGNSLKRFPGTQVVLTPIRLALLEWSRKAELSCDRAGLLAVQDPDISMAALMRIAGGSRGEELDLEEFVAQSDEYRSDGDLLDAIYKFRSMMLSTHPFAVVRVAELRDWIDSGDYERILEGDYRAKADDVAYTEDIGDAAGTYAGKAKGFVDDIGGKVGSIAGKVTEAWNNAGSNAVYVDGETEDDS